MQNGKPRKSCLLSSYSQLDKDVSRLAASVINDDRRCRSGGYRVAHLQSIQQVSPALPASPASPVFSITAAGISGDTKIIVSWYQYQQYWQVSADSRYQYSANPNCHIVNNTCEAEAPQNCSQSDCSRMQNS